jgi:membrane protein implicated in regulation of membrane protease activity
VEYGLAAIVLLALVAVAVWWPLRRPGEEQRREDAERAELEAAKEAKYREIRDAELDHRMGKTSEEDWKALDRQLRGEAIEILRRLDSLP